MIPGISFFIKLIMYILFLSSSLLVSVQGGSLINAQRSNSSSNIDLVAFLSQKTHAQDRIFTEALELLESMKSSPSCNRIAASRLVTSCQSIGRKLDASLDSDTYVNLEYVRSLYAARLAVCELSGTGASVPTPCLAVNELQPQKKGIFGFSSKQKTPITSSDPISKELLESCLKLLESRPQWWTSYSNSRQNAVVICQAARAENEKEELLELHRSIVQNSIKLNQGLQDALREAAKESERQRDFVHLSELMKAEAVHEMEESTSHFKDILRQSLKGVEIHFSSIMNTISSTLGRAQASTTTLEKSVQNATIEASHLQKILHAIEDETRSWSEQLKREQQQDLLAHEQISFTIQSKLQSILKSDSTRLAQNIKAFDNSLEWLYARVGHIIQQEESLSERFRKFGESLDEFQIRAESLREVQLQQNEAAEAQSRIQETLDTNMRIAQGFLDQAASTAADLQTMIDDTASKHRQMSAQSRPLEILSTWIFRGSLLLFGVRTPKVAILVLFVVSCMSDIPV